MSKITSKKLIEYTQLATAIFMFMVVMFAVFGWPVCKYICFVLIGVFTGWKVAYFVACYYLMLVGAGVLLVGLMKLLSNMKKGVLFDESNAKSMAIIAGSCIAIGLVAGAAAVVYPTMVLITALGVFMGLVVLCVRQLADEALGIKEENDLTI